MRDVLQIISGSKDNVELLENLMNEVGEDPNDWGRTFLTTDRRT